MISRSWLIFVLMIVAAVVGIVVWQLRPKPVVHPGSDRSDYTVRDFDMVALNGAGKEAFTVTGPLLEREPAGKTITLTTPKFSFPDRQGGRWHAESGRAWVSAKGEEVRLLDQVLMLGPVTPKGEQTRFATARLTIFPKQNKAQSDDQVTVSRADSILHGQGMRADMQTKRFQLLADVKGRYAPHTH